MPVSWQIGPSSSTAMSMLERIMLKACEDCVFGVSDSETICIAARTSGGRLVEVWGISSSKLLDRNCMNFILPKVLRNLVSGGETTHNPSPTFPTLHQRI